jgi:hypothetical protein
VRDLTTTHLEMHLTTRYGWCMCDSGCLAGYAREPVTKTVRFNPELNSFGNRLVVVQCEGPLPCV